jgi:hypothetical protein
MAVLTRPESSTVSTVQLEGRSYENGMSEQDAIRFRQQAGEARARAADVTNVIDKEAWLLVAEDWLKLAQAVDARHGN